MYLLSLAHTHAHTHTQTHTHTYIFFYIYIYTYISIYIFKRTHTPTHTVHECKWKHMHNSVCGAGDVNLARSRLANHLTKELMKPAQKTLDAALESIASRMKPPRCDVPLRRFRACPHLVHSLSLFLFLFNPCLLLPAHWAELITWRWPRYMNATGQLLGPTARVHGRLSLPLPVRKVAAGTPPQDSTENHHVQKVRSNDRCARRSCRSCRSSYAPEYFGSRACKGPE